MNLNLSVWSVELLLIGCEKEKFKGPTGVNQSIPSPIELLILLPSSRALLSTPHKFATSRNETTSMFWALGKIWGKVDDLDYL